MCRAAQHDGPSSGEWFPRELLNVFPLPPVQVEHLRTHDAHTFRDQILRHVLIWRPEAVAEAARHRPDDRPGDSAWAQLRAMLEALGVLRPDGDHGPPVLGELLTSCCVGSPGPPVLAAARRSHPRIAAHCMGAPVISP